MTHHYFFATAPKGMEPLLVAELRTLGASKINQIRAGASFEGSLATAYRVCLWSRIANRVLLTLAEFEAKTPEALYEGVRALDWSEQLTAEGTLAVDCNISRSRINHTYFAALKVKDAIVDQFRDDCGIRPSVDTHQPDVRINVHIHNNEVTLSLDLSGNSLHRRGYRQEDVEAPLKENLAAALLLLADWPRIARSGGALVDPTCGSGTLPIEAALIAADIAPGLLRSYFGFIHWRGHDEDAWAELKTNAQIRREQGLKNLPPIFGFDANSNAVHSALANIEAAGLHGYVHVERRELAAPFPLADRNREQPGLCIANPPHGERLGQFDELRFLYARLGEKMRSELRGWSAAVFTSNPDLASCVGIAPRDTRTLYNGAIECKLMLYDIPQTAPTPSLSPASPISASKAVMSESAAPDSGVIMFANRLRKNLKQLTRWAQQNEVNCYRVYDADLPEYALAVDLYHGAKRWAHIQEYAAPKTIDPAKAEQRLQQALAVIPEMLNIPAEQMYFKIRRKQKGDTQYQKFAMQGHYEEVSEGPCKLLVNFTDYLDTGLFLDHRPMRELIQKEARGKKFLNLFGYTGSATVHAAAGGATATTTVDLSPTYIAWARRNLALNGFSEHRHELIQADCLTWLAEESALKQHRRRYGLIFLDTPTFSNSKRTDNVFDVQRDHVDMIRQTISLLEPQGTLFFSNNFRRFKLDTQALQNEVNVEDITRQSIPYDFQRNLHIHHCWKITRKDI